MQYILLAIVLGLLLFSVSLLAIERHQRIRAMRSAERGGHAPADGGGTARSAQHQRRARRRRLRMNAANSRNPKQINLR